MTNRESHWCTWNDIADLLEHPLSLKDIGTDMDRSHTYDFLLTTGLYRTVSEINDDFSR